jgi:diguanylate cyclase (GGDEF)-like protein
MLRSLRRRSSWQGEMRGRRKDGSIYPCWLSVSAVADEKGTVGRYVAIFRDISVTKQTAEQLFHMAHFDNLTGLVNRQAFLDRLNRALVQAARFGERLGLLFIDLDGFKLINDNLGHVIGDRLLALLAARITDCVRQSDTVARIGGDEFTVILPMLKSSEDAARVAQKIIHHIAEPARHDEHELLITASVGIAIFPEDGAEAEGLLQNADTAMYLAKELGRSQYQFFSPAMNRQATEKLQLQNKLREAAGGSEIMVYYQPQLQADSGELVGLEALARWNDPSQGLIGPERFIPVAEETGLIHQIGRQVLLTACRQGRAWQEQGFKPLRIAINISAHQLRRPDFVSLVQSSLAESGLAPGLLELEITETSLIGDAFDIASKLRLIKSLGVSITIDDFGTKYSSLSYLKRLPIDRLKIDRSFVRDIPHDPSSMEIASAIIAMARSLRLEVVAEGVESRRQAEFLKSKGCHYLQGFYYHHPLPPQSVTPILKRKETRGAARSGA